MKKMMMVLALLAFMAPMAAQAWVCVAEAPNGAAGTGMSPYIWEAQQTAVYYCQMDGGGAYCAVLSCQ